MKIIQISSLAVFLSAWCVLAAYALDLPWEKPVPPATNLPAAMKTTPEGPGVADLAQRAAAGEADAQNKLGEACRDGLLGQNKDLAAAARWCRKAAEQGHPLAQYNLARLLRKGEGVAKDQAEAVVWLRKASEQGLAEAQLLLGYCTEKGEGTAMALNEAFTWYLKAAEQNQPVAQCNVGNAYTSGGGVTKDLAAAFQWYSRAAANGHAKALRTVGYCLLEGIGVEPDKVAAATRFREAADKGNEIAMNDLGRCYQFGWGVTSDLAEAAQWYGRSAKAGCMHGMYNLGQLRETGAGVPADPAQALAWYQKAAKAGHPEAARAVARLAGQPAASTVSDGTPPAPALDLSDAKAKAGRLRDEGAELQNRNDLQGAVAKYRASLAFWPDPALEKHIALLEEKLPDARQGNEQEGDRIWKEGRALYAQGQYQSALERFHASLKLKETQERSESARKLAAWLAEQKQ